MALSKKRLIGLTVATVATVITLSGCGAGSGSGASGSANADAPLIGLIMKTNDVAYWQQMQQQAEASAADAGLRIQVFAGTSISDNETQVNAIESLIAAGAKGIMITPSDPEAIVSAIADARAAGIAVVALDTPTSPADAVDATYTTDNYHAGQLIGEWAAAKFASSGVQPQIGLIDYSSDQINVDVQRDQGFLNGFGIDVGDPSKFGDETDPRIVGRGLGLLTLGDSRTAMENLLQTSPGINLVYTVNETTALGAIEAIKAAGKSGDITVVSIDGSCDGLKAMQDGDLSATAQQFPKNEAVLGVQALSTYISNGTLPTNTGGGDATDSGTVLVTGDPQTGVDSVGIDEGLASCF